MFLDTNFLIANGNGGSPAAQQVDQWVLDGTALHVPAMAWAEYLCGPLIPAKEVSTMALLTTIHPLDAEIATLAAQLFNATGRRDRSLPDCLIAAIAILSRMPLATLNHADFLPFTPFDLTLA